MSSPLAILVDFGWLYVSSGLKYISHVSLMSLCILKSGIIVRLLIKRLMWKCCRYILVAKGIRTMCVLIYEVICNPSCWSYLPSWMKRKFKSKVLKLKFTFTNSWREEGKKKIIIIINERKRVLSSPAGNRTPVSRVTGGDTHHYTTEDLISKYVKITIFIHCLLKSVTVRTRFPIYYINNIKQIDSKLLCVFSVVDHKGRQNVVRTSVTHSASPRVPLFCSYQILTSFVIYYWKDARQLGIYLLNLSIYRPNFYLTIYLSLYLYVYYTGNKGKETPSSYVSEGKTVSNFCCM